MRTVGNALLQAVQSQGIPTVVAFSGGQPVNMFIGAYPEPEVNRFIDSILPSEAEVEADEALAEESRRRSRVGGAGYRDALEKDPENREAAVGLARILVGRGEFDEAKALVEPFSPTPTRSASWLAVRVHDWGAREVGRSAIGEAGGRRRDGGVRRSTDCSRHSTTTATRESMVDVFATLDDDPLVGEYRPKLAARLF